MTVLIVGLLFGIVGVFADPVVVYNANGNELQVELKPSEVVQVNSDVHRFYFHNVDWKTGGNYLSFISNHQKVRAEADGVLLFERDYVPSAWGNTTGFAWEYIEIPIHAQEVTVTLTACYPQVSEPSTVFYKGEGVEMFRQQVHSNFFSLITSIIAIVLGLFMLVFWFIKNIEAESSLALFHLGIFSVLLGTWCCMDGDVFVLLVPNRTVCTYISIFLLMIMGIPFIMFVKRFLRTEDKCLHCILTGVILLNIAVCFVLQVAGIADFKQTLGATHLCMTLAMLYMLYAVVEKLKKHEVTQQVKICLYGFLICGIALFISIVQYYVGIRNFSQIGGTVIFSFVIVLCADVSRETLREIEDGRRAEIYQEMAEKDSLTRCYNRNAYHYDTYEREDLAQIGIVVCDLNNLKLCNDTLGHAFGDKYIVDAAGLLQEVFSDCGKIYRVGGDEFCVIIPNARPRAISLLYAALLEKERLYNAASAHINMQIAFGYAVFDGTVDADLEDTRHRADERMYQNKQEMKRISVR
jgi:diguanylate cyclase (GGDEF)-like protein